MSSEIQATTPLMLQYQAIKRNFPDALLLFQVGDFYELFYDDAKKAAAFLAITLTARGKNNGDPIPLCGVPVHAAEFYIAKLVKGGFKVALCNQLEPATPGRVVERGVAQVFTPGTLTDARLLDEKSASYLFSFFPVENQWGLLFAELMTAQLFATVLPACAEKTLQAELGRFSPDEIIVPAQKLALPFEQYFSKMGFYTTIASYNAEKNQEALRWIEQQFTNELQIQIRKHTVVESALSLFHNYLKKNQEASLPLFNQFSYYQPEDFLMLDAATQRNLELVKNMHDGTRKNSLYEHLDHAVTAMGSRTLKKWIVRPLVKKETILSRQEIVQKFIQDVVLSHEIKKLLSEIGDLERIVGRIMLRRATVHDFNALAKALEVIPEFRSELSMCTDTPVLQRFAHQLGNFSELCSLLLTALNNDVTREWIIKAGFNQHLDHLRSLIDDQTVIINRLEQSEQQKTGINSLKIRYNSIYGYYIEVTKANIHLIPDYFIRTQSLVGKDRFTTVELKTIEAEVIIAKNQIGQLEREIFEQIKRDVMKYGSDLRKMAFALASIDALFGLSQVAYHNGYIRPLLEEGTTIEIKNGKHPILAQSLGNAFISNTTLLNHESYFWIITGPNMGGKSTYLRQVALITLMAQIGSFVPADSAIISMRDRIFTRIGAGDNVAQGKSTFLLEMEETAIICEQATEKSLIILDELGRGTSTFDGLAIAQAVVEYLYVKVKAPCLFATHYHELTALKEDFPSLDCYYASSRKTQDGILLLHKIEKGSADGSFGVEVARFAGIPEGVIVRAQEILELLERSENSYNDRCGPESSTVFYGSQKDTNELSLVNEKLLKQIEILERTLQQRNTIIERFEHINYNELSPKMAFDILWQLKENND